MKKRWLGISLLFVVIIVFSVVLTWTIVRRLISLEIARLYDEIDVARVRAMYSGGFPIKHSDDVNAVAFSSDGKYALSGSSDGTMRLVEVYTGCQIRAFSGTNFTAVAFSPDNSYILSGSKYGNVKLWDVNTGREIRSFAGHRIRVTSLAFSSNGLYAISTAYDIKAKQDFPKLWDVATGKCIQAYWALGYSRSATFSPDAEAIISDKEQFELDPRKIIRMPPVPSGSSPDGKYLFWRYQKGFTLWDSSMGGKVRDIPQVIEDFKAVYSIALSPDNRYAVFTQRSSEVKLLDLSTDELIYSFPGHTDFINSVAFSPDSRYVLSGSSDNTMRLWEVATGREVRYALDPSEVSTGKM